MWFDDKVVNILLVYLYVLSVWLAVIKTSLYLLLVMFCDCIIVFNMLSGVIILLSTIQAPSSY